MFNKKHCFQITFKVLATRLKSDISLDILTHIHVANESQLSSKNKVYVVAFVIVMYQMEIKNLKL